MKVHLLTLIFIYCVLDCQAQWTTSGDNIVNSNTGNVGIGTSAPAEKIDVVGNIRASQNMLLGNLESTTSFNNAYFVYKNCNYYGLYLGFGGSLGRFSTRLFTPASGDIVFSSIPYETVPSAQSQFSPLMTIKSDNGFVGIGTTNPQEALSVNGRIRSKQVVVETTNWPDFVFKRNYNLKPLYWLQGFIEKNNHLPEIPTKSEIAKNGHDLGEMNKLLVKKVEEMTLYLIDLNKRLEQLEGKKASE